MLLLSLLLLLVVVSAEYGCVDSAKAKARHKTSPYKMSALAMALVVVNFRISRIQLRGICTRTMKTKKIAVGIFHPVKACTEECRLCGTKMRYVKHTPWCKKYKKTLVKRIILGRFYGTGANAEVLSELTDCMRATPTLTAVSPLLPNAR